MNKYPTFFEQLEADMARRPEIYRSGFDRYEEHLLRNNGLHVTDPSRAASFIPRDLAENSFLGNQDTYIQDKLTRERKLEEERLANRPFLFIFCSRLSSHLKDILK